MISSRAPLFAAVALLSSSFSVGCSGPDEGFDGSYEMPILTALTGGNGGTGGDNGLTSVIFHKNKKALLDATNFPLVDPLNNFIVNNGVVQTGLLSTEDGRLVFSYAVRCALAAGQTIQMVSPAMKFPGGGILTSTASWLSAGLTVGQKEDLFTCMVTHLNPKGAHIPIWLTGSHVTETAPTPPEYNVQEALWLAKVDSSGIHFYVWPLPGVEAFCPAVDSDLGTRTCDGFEDCGLQVRHDMSNACKGSGDVWECMDGHAIKTRLERFYLDALYVECCPPDVCPS